MKFPERVQCCYCEKPATTQDHIPPKCFFPAKSHLSDGVSDYKSHLITVPACLEHNNSRSRDDAYTAAIIALHSKSDIAFTIFKSKWIKTLLKHEDTLEKRILSTSRNARVVSKKDNILTFCGTLAISYEAKRIERVIKSIARALYCLESDCQEKWTNSCIVKSPNFHNQHLNSSQDVHTLGQINHVFIHGANYQELGLLRKGVHPDVFYYQFFKFEDESFIIRMVFYRDVTFLTFLKRDRCSLG